MKKRFLSLITAIFILTSVFLLASCGADELKGEYICEEPYLRIDIPDSDIIDFKGEMNLNGENCDITFSYNKDTNHFEIKRDDELIFDGYYTTSDSGKKLHLEANEAVFDLVKVEN